jgi:hypothetical protein
MTATSDAFKDIIPSLLHPPLPSPTIYGFSPAMNDRLVQPDP